MNEHLPGSKIAERLFSRPEGATMAEVIAATGGRQHNLLERLKARGYTVRSRKEGPTTRYWAVRGGEQSYVAPVTLKGQVTLPKEVREKLYLRGAGKIRFVLQDDKIYIDRKTGSLDELFGLLHRPGMRARTIEEMDEGIRKAVTERYLRAVGRLK
jgi:AbrB family looped-hinge helix DNA binding protein